MQPNPNISLGPCYPTIHSVLLFNRVRRQRHPRYMPSLITLYPTGGFCCSYVSRISSARQCTYPLLLVALAVMYLGGHINGGGIPHCNNRTTILRGRHSELSRGTDFTDMKLCTSYLYAAPRHVQWPNSRSIARRSFIYCRCDVGGVWVQLCRP